MKRSASVLTLIGVLLTPAAVMARQAATRTITVNGQAEIRVAPDEVLITVGIETDDLDIARARAENDRRVKAVVDAAVKEGVGAEHVRSEFLDIQPRYKNDYDRHSFIGYFARRSLAITLRDVARFESLVTAVLTAGANYIHGIDFRTTQLRKHRDEARALALKAAREKAVAMTSALGTTAGAPVAVQEGHSGWWSPYSSWWGNRGGSWMAQNVVQNRPNEAGPGEGSLVPGQISVSANVTVTFDLGNAQK